MGQLNIHMTAEFEKELHKFMKIRHIDTKAAAIRIAIKEGIEHSMRQANKSDFSDWAGLAAEAPTNPKPRFTSDDDIWK